MSRRKFLDLIWADGQDKMQILSALKWKIIEQTFHLLIISWEGYDEDLCFIPHGTEYDGRLWTRSGMRIVSAYLGIIQFLIFLLKFAPCLFFVYSCVCLCVCIWWASIKVRLVVKSSACSTMTYAVGLCSTTTYAVLWHIMYAVLQHMQYYKICCMQYYNICKHVCIHVSMLKGFHGSYFLVWSRNVSLWFGQRNASFWFGLCIMQCPLLVWSTSLFLVKECLILVWYYRNVSFWFDQANASFWFGQANVYLFWPGNTSLWFGQEKASLRLLYSQRANGYNILYCTS